MEATTTDLFSFDSTTINPDLEQPLILIKSISAAVHSSLNFTQLHTQSKKAVTMVDDEEDDGVTAKP